MLKVINNVAPVARSEDLTEECARRYRLPVAGGFGAFLARLRGEDNFPEWADALELAALYEKLEKGTATRQDAMRARDLVAKRAMTNRMIDHALGWRKAAIKR